VTAPMTTASWAAAMDGDPLSLYAYCDWLEERGLGGDALALRELPELARRCVGDPRWSAAYKATFMRGSRAGHLWVGDLYWTRIVPLPERLHRTVRCLVAGATPGSALAPAVRWFERAAGTRISPPTGYHVHPGPDTAIFHILQGYEQKED
jgi:hypothetical protein